MRIDRDKIKSELTIEQVYDFLVAFGGEPRISDDIIISKTICHHKAHEGSDKLYYYDNSKLFKCYTDCEHSSFDIFELTRRIFLNQKGKELSYFEALQFVSQYFNFSYENIFIQNFKTPLKDWSIFEEHSKIKDVNQKKRIELKYYDNHLLEFYPQYRIEDWENDYINFDIMKDYNIHYRPERHSVLIPHYDLNNNLIGIRERTLIKEEEIYGKYRPAIIHGTMCNHPLGLNLYGLNKTISNIKGIKKAIIAEGEKASLQHASMFGGDSNICVACCGSHISTPQMNLLLKEGVQEVIIALDKQFKKIGDDEWTKLTNGFKELNKKYSSYTKLSFIFDDKDLLEYKDSPWDKGKEVFLKLFEERRYIS